MLRLVEMSSDPLADAAAYRSVPLFSVRADERPSALPPLICSVALLTVVVPEYVLTPLNTTVPSPVSAAFPALPLPTMAAVPIVKLPGEPANLSLTTPVTLIVLPVVAAIVLFRPDPSAIGR